MSDKLYNKIIYGSEVLIDLTSDDLEESDVTSGKKFHDRTGAAKVGTNTFDADTSDADALASEILATKTAYVNGSKITGTMPNRSGVSGVISDVDEPYLITNGYHDGSGTVSVDPIEKGKLIPNNIKSGVSILGVLGSYEGESGRGQSKEVTPNKDGFSVLPDIGYDYLTQVTVKAIPYRESLNSAGGYTVTIANS